MPVGVDNVGPLPDAPALHYGFSHRHDMSAVLSAEFTADPPPNVLANQYARLWGCTRSILTENVLHICSKLPYVVYKLLRGRKIATKSCRSNRDGEVELVDHTMIQMPAVVAIELQANRDKQLSHVEFRSPFRSALPPA